MLEAVFEVLGELLLQAVGEALVEIGLHSMAAPFRRPPNPWLAALGYAIFGAILGGVSVLVFPHHFVPPPWRVLNLLLTPLLVGVFMAGMGAWRARRGQPTLLIDRFMYGYLFALPFGLVRFLAAS